VCGIAGALSTDPREAQRAVEAMCSRMVPRGPDDDGMNVIPAGDKWMALGSTRLAIIDLSPAGHQPMHDPDRETTIVYNGMIYNFRELRERLRAQGESFVSACDTEVILKSYGRYGPDCVRHLHGMFAFAIWDARRQQLFLARDRIGIKPLYYAQVHGRFLFGSEVKALLATRLLPIRLCRPGLMSYLAFGAISEPLTAIEQVLELPAGHTAILSHGELHIRRFWDFPETPEAQAESAVGELHDRLARTVRRHLVSDAPLGVFLSGGLDSSVLAALAAREGGDVRTVCVSFEEASFDEAEYAQRVAAHIGSRHTVVRLRPGDLLEGLDRAFEAMDQPTFDGLNTYVVSQAAKESGLTAAISGLGGDELFDGYAYAARVRRLEALRRIPCPVAAPLGSILGLANGRAGKAAAWLSGQLESGRSYELLRRVFLPSSVKRLMRSADTSAMPRPAPLEKGLDIYNYVAIADLSNYTRNVLLRDTDSMSMANSLEVRVPFLDDQFVEWTLRLPGYVKNGNHKRLLKAAAGHLLPEDVLARPKQGFALPLPLWLRHDLADDVEVKLTRPPEVVAAELSPSALAELWLRYSRRGGRWTTVWALYALCRWVDSLDALPRRAG
jgi:asparagine synthase (glutamine-hydrolysing)